MTARPVGALVRAFMLGVALALCAGSGARAAEAVPTAEDPALEQRLLRISEDVRCLVCQNESLAGSRADLANDLRREIRKMIREGRTDDEIREFLVSRYGDFVLYKPPLKPVTWLLWFGPFVLLLSAVAFLVMFLRRRQRDRVAHADPGLSEAERRQAQQLLDSPDVRS